MQGDCLIDISHCNEDVETSLLTIDMECYKSASLKADCRQPQVSVKEELVPDEPLNVRTSNSYALHNHELQHSSWVNQHAYLNKGQLIRSY